MVNRSLFRSLCKTLAVVCVPVMLAANFARAQQAQITAETASPPAVARTSFGAPAEKLKLAGVPNAGKISEALLRGAQPSEQGLAELKKLGVTTVVDLRGNRGPVTRERARVEALGMRFVDIPVGGWSAPSNAQVAEFLKLFRDDPNQKIFVHCYYGADRSGVMVATYRIAEQNWTADQAVAEMYSFGFHYHWYPAMKTYVRKFAAEFGADPAFSSFRQTTAR